MARGRDFSHRLPVLTGAVWVWFCCASIYAQSPLPAVEALFDSTQYRQAQWGYCVIDLDTMQVIAEQQADKMFAPASTSKLFSVACALDTLGADHRFVTRVYRRGDLDNNGRLRGDLILVAAGDLTLGGRNMDDGKIAYVSNDHTYANGASNGTQSQLTEPDPLAGLDDLARKVAAAGIKQIRGDILVDTRMFDEAASSGSGPTRVTPVLINDNLLDFRLTATNPGELAKLAWRPQTSSLRVDSSVVTAAEGEPLQLEIKAVGPRNVVLSGQIPLGSVPLVRTFEVLDPDSFARSLFLEALQRVGIVVERSVLADNAADKLPPREAFEKIKPVAEFTSLPFSEHAKLILKSSHNLHASTLPLLVAAKNGKRTLEDGLFLQRDFLVRAGVSPDAISFGGGAGGSPADMVTPRETVKLLKYMASRPDAGVYRGGLPILGVDGTLYDAVDENSPARGHVQAKTGTLFWNDALNRTFIVQSKALAGYMTTKGKKELAFAIFVNQAHAEKDADVVKIGQTLAKFCEILWSNY